MKHRPLKQLCGLIASAAIALVLIGCNGKAGQNGLNGTNGTNGTNGSAPAVNAAILTPEQWADLQPTVTISSVAITAGKPVVSFKIADLAGNGIKGLGGFTSQSATATLPSYPNLAFAIAKLVPEDAVTKAPSKWVSYIVSTVPTKNASTGAITAATASKPTTDNTGTLVDNGDGTYVYTFYRDITTMQAFLNGLTLTAPNDKADLGDVTYAPNLVHRLDVQLSGNARGTGSNTPNGVTVATGVAMNYPVNQIYDFIPATGQPIAAGVDNRDVVKIVNCNECHSKLAFHGGGRVETRYCVVCHTDQRKYGNAEAAAGTTTTYTGSTYKIKGLAQGDMTIMAHRIHMGNELSKTGYNYANVLFDKLGYSMIDKGVRMCIKCHDGGAQSTNWKTKPSRMACGACHDSTDFTTTHGGAAAIPAQSSDVACAGCHTAATIPVYHYTLNKTTHNPVVSKGLTNFTYEIASATQAAPVAGVAQNVVIKFRIMAEKDGATPAPVVFSAAAAGMANPLTGFTGSPSFQLAWAMQQEGIASPADFNNLLTADGAPSSSNYQPRSVSIAALLDTGKTLSDGTLSAPDASGYYTATIVGAARIFPAGAKLRTVGLQGYFTQNAGTWDSDNNGVIDASDTLAAARHSISVTKTLTGETARRVAVDNNKCMSCHEWFEGHGGNRVYDINICLQCHLPGLVTSGKGIADAELSTYYNANLFTANDKESLTKWTGVSFATNPVTAGNVNVGLLFPQTSNNMKDMIHGLHAGKDRTSPIQIVRNRLPGALNVIDGARIGFPGILNNCQMCHTYNGYNVPTSGALLATRDQAINVAGNTTPALAKAALATSNATDLMITPFTATCFSCHDSAPAQAHMKLNGGQIRVARSALATAGESCAACHRSGADFDPVKVHK